MLRLKEACYMFTGSVDPVMVVQLHESRIKASVTYTCIHVAPQNYPLNLTIFILIKTIGLRCRQHKQRAPFGY